MTSRPRGESTRSAASAGRPQTGSRTRSSPVPARRAPGGPAIASASSPAEVGDRVGAEFGGPVAAMRGRGTPRPPVRPRAGARPAPRSGRRCRWRRARARARRGCRPARQVSAIQAAIAESPSAAARSSLTSSRSGSIAVSGTTHSWAMEPSPGRMPAVQLNQTRWPAGMSSASAMTPTPWVPGTYGSAGAPKYEVPEAQSRSSGLIGRGRHPDQCLARLRGAAPGATRPPGARRGGGGPPPAWSRATSAVTGAGGVIVTLRSSHSAHHTGLIHGLIRRARVLGVGVGVGVVEDPGLRDLRVHALGPGVGAELALEVVDRLLDHLPGLAEVRRRPGGGRT